MKQWRNQAAAEIGAGGVKISQWRKHRRKSGGENGANSSYRNNGIISINAESIENGGISKKSLERKWKIMQRKYHHGESAAYQRISVMAIIVNNGGNKAKAK